MDPLIQTADELRLVRFFNAEAGVADGVDGVDSAERDESVAGSAAVSRVDVNAGCTEERLVRGLLEEPPGEFRRGELVIE